MAEIKYTNVITGETIGGNKPWVARITGTDPKFGLKREFVNGVRDYSESNSVGSRGVTTTWILADGIYEISIPQTWKRTDRSFLTIKNSTAYHIDKIDVLKLMQEVSHA